MNLQERISKIVKTGAISKDGQMTQAGKYNYHTIDGVVDHLRQLFVKHKIGFEYDVVGHELKILDNGTLVTVKEVIATFYCTDDPEDRMTVCDYGYGIDRQDKGPGKATSYALKTIFTALFMLKGQPDENDAPVPLDMEVIGVAEALKLQAEVDAEGIDHDRFLKAADAPSFERIPKHRLGNLRQMIQARRSN